MSLGLLLGGVGGDIRGLKKLFKLILLVVLMGAKLLIGVVVVLIIIWVTAIFFLWGGDDVALNENESVGNNESESAGNVVEEVGLDDEDVSVDVSVSAGGVGAVLVYNISIGSSLEEIKLAKENKFLNVGEMLVDVSGRRIHDDVFPDYLGKVSGKRLEYSSEIKLSGDLTLEKFSNNDYADGNKTTGFVLLPDDLILDYEISFSDEILWEDFVREDIRIFGVPYKVVASDYDTERIDLFEFPYSFSLMDDDVVNIESYYYDANFSIYFADVDDVILMIDGERTERLSAGDIYRGDNFSVFVDDFWYSSTNKKNLVNLVISPREISLVDGIIMNEFGEVEGIEVFIEDDEYLEKIMFSWYIEDDTFFTPDENYSSLTIPFFDSLTLSMDDYKRDPDRKKYWNIDMEATSYEVVNETRKV